MSRLVRSRVVQQPGIQGETCEARYRSNVQLPHQALTVALDGPAADPELSRDLLVALACRYALEHIQLAGREHVQAWPRSLSLVSP